MAVNNIFKYLRRTKDVFMIYGDKDNDFHVKGYMDANFQPNKDDFESQSIYVFTLNGGLKSWKGSKQETIADSIT